LFVTAPRGIPQAGIELAYATGVVIKCPNHYFIYTTVMPG
jgi:hypothetical protein